MTLVQGNSSISSPATLNEYQATYFSFLTGGRFTFLLRLFEVLYSHLKIYLTIKLIQSSLSLLKWCYNHALINIFQFFMTVNLIIFQFHSLNNNGIKLLNQRSFPFSRSLSLHLLLKIFRLLFFCLFSVRISSSVPMCKMMAICLEPVMTPPPPQDWPSRLLWKYNISSTCFANYF